MKKKSLGQIAFFCLAFFCIVFNGVSALDKIAIAETEQNILLLHHREFIDYLEEQNILRMIIDDGHSSLVDNLEGVTARYYIDFIFYESLGECEAPLLRRIEKKSVDLLSGQETLLEIVINNYSEEGKLLHQEFFFPNGDHFLLIYDEEGNKKECIDNNGITIDIASLTIASLTVDVRSNSSAKMTLGQYSSLREIIPMAFSFYRFLADSSDAIFSFLQSKIPFFPNLHMASEEIGSEMIGKALSFLDSKEDNTESAVFGEGEVSSKVRITHINGILNSKIDSIKAAKVISQMHGAVNVHYTYRSSQGWTSDFLKSCLIKIGYTSDDASELAKSWKELIAEMGGVENGGLIIHYAHSLGGAETYAAKNMLTPEEQKMIKVTTFGSPTLIPNEGFLSVINYVGKGDMVSFCDPVTYFQGIFDPMSNVVFIGNNGNMVSWYDLLVLVDHRFLGEIYRPILEKLGREFVETYGTIQPTSK